MHVPPPATAFHLCSVSRSSSSVHSTSTGPPQAAGLATPISANKSAASCGYSPRHAFAYAMIAGIANLSCVKSRTK